MSNFVFVTAEQYNNLEAGSPEEQFVALAELARESLSRHLENDANYGINGRGEADDIKSQFIGAIEGIAEELGIKDFKEAKSHPDEAYAIVQRQLQRLSARYRIRERNSTSPTSIKLSRAGKGWIRQQIGQLITFVDSADLPEWQRKRIIGKLQDALAAVDKGRFSYAVVMAALVPVAAIFGPSMTGLANAPAAMETVQQLIVKLGEEHARNEEQQLLLEAPRSALPASEDATDDDLDDDVPF